LLFDGHKVSSVLSFSKPEYTLIQRDQQTRLSISGVQNKVSLTLEEGRLVPTDVNGMYILKPAIVEHHYPHASPANEHITMQIATQVYKYPVAANALIRFSDGELAYMTRRFDRQNDGTKLAQEDFCQLLKKQ
jgi:serine/threonine-protein kinase HipA